MTRVVIKLDSAVCAPGVRAQAEREIEHLAAEVAAIMRAGHEAIVVLAGASVWGSYLQLPTVRREDVHASRGKRGEQLLELQTLAAVGQSLLIEQVVRQFATQDLPVGQILITRNDLADQFRYENVRLVTLKLLAMGAIPIFNENDVLSAEEIDSTDNDQLACMLATALQADKVMLVKGASLGDGPQSRARRASTDEAVRLLTGFGVEVSILSGDGLNGWSRALTGDAGVGEVFPPRDVKLRQRKSWVALAAQSRGELVVSTFLAEALRNRRPVSILVIGVEQVIGSFQRNDVVTVKDIDGVTLGRGEVKVSSRELLELVAKRLRGEKLELFGSEVIHCDYFVGTPRGEV